MNLRAILRRFVYTPNTIRYRVEWNRLREAWAKIPHPAGRVFDGGAGSGEYCRRAMQEGFVREAVCLEYDSGNFVRLKENLGSNPAATLIQGSVLDVPVESASVDVVMSTQVLEHIADHEKAASEFNRVLKPGGYGLITVPHPPEPFPNDDHVREGYTEEELAALFAPHGWKPLWTDYFLVRETVDMMMAADRLFRAYIPLPVSLVDRDAGLNWEQRKANRPFGILMLFQKGA